MNRGLPLTSSILPLNEIDSLASIASKILKFPELILASRDPCVILDLNEQIKKVLCALYGYLHGCFTSTPRKSIKKHLSQRRVKASVLTSRQLCVEEVNLDQILIQLDELISPRVKTLKNLVFEFVGSVQKSPNELDLFHSRQSSPLENDEGDPSHTPSTHEEASLETTTSDDDSLGDWQDTEKKDKHKKKDLATKVKKNSKQKKEKEELDLFNYDEMKRFMDEGYVTHEDSLDRDSEDTLLAEDHPATPSSVSAKEDLHLDTLLNRYQDLHGSEKEEEEEEESSQGELSDLDEMEHMSEESLSPPTEEVSSSPMGGVSLPPQKHQGEKSELLALVEKENQLVEEINQIEQEIVKEKHWSLKGEISGKARDPNSLLELHLELPQYHHQDSIDQQLLAAQSLGSDNVFNEEDAQHMKTQVNDSQEFLHSALSAKIEKIVIGRIRYLLFDDVVRKFMAPPSAKNNDTVNDEQVLDFKKSQVGLADQYAEDYVKQVLKGTTVKDLEMNKKYQEINQLFETIMYKIDALSCHRVLPKPLTSKGEVREDVSAIIVEDTIPCTISTAQRKAPEEVLAPDVLKKPDEMTKEERRALHRTKKERRKKRQRSELLTGQISLHDAIQRSLHLKDKNRKEKELLKQKRKTGSLSEFGHGKRLKSGRINTTNLLAEAMTKHH